MDTLRTLICLLALLVMPFALNGCNTMEGAGEDIEGTGESIEETSRDWQD